MPDNSNVTELYETSVVKTANEKLKEGWRLIRVAQRSDVGTKPQAEGGGTIVLESPAYILGR